MTELLSTNRIGLWHVSNKLKPDHTELGYKPESELYYSDCPYMRDGIKVARVYIDGIGCQQRHAIYHLK